MPLREVINKIKMKVCLLSKGGGEGQTTNKTFLDFILVIVYNIYRVYLEIVLLFFSLNFKWEQGGGLKKLRQKTYFYYSFYLDLPKALLMGLEKETINLFSMFKSLNYSLIPPQKYK